MAERWLFVDGAGTFGGHEVMMLRLVSELSCQRLVTPRVLSRGASLLREKSSAFSTSLCLPARPANSSRAGRILHSIRELRVFFAVLSAERPTLCILAEGCLLSQPFLALLCRLARLPFAIYVPIVDPATSLGFGRGELRDRIVRHGYGNLPDAWITLTREQAAAFASWSGTRRPVLVLPNAVSAHIEALSREPLPQPRDGSPAPLRVLVFGRFDAHQKGLDLLLDHVARHPRASWGVHLSLIGDGPFRDEIQRRIRACMPLRHTVHLAGWTDSVAAYRDHDILLLPSRFEGVPLVMLEAMALGLPVVASDLPGTRAYLPADCLFAVGDLERAFAILAAMREPATRRAVAERNRTVFARRVSGAAFAEAVGRLTSELSRIVGDHPSRPRRSVGPDELDREPPVRLREEN